MRPRLLFIVVALLLLAGFAAMNWSEFNRITPLSFGIFVTDAALGMVMLVVVGITLVAWLLSSAMNESRYMIETNRHAKALQAQRDLADKAETSRFHELRQQLETHLKDNRQRDAITSTEFERMSMQAHRDLGAQIEQLGRTLATRLADLENRIDGRVDRVPPTVHPEVIDVPPRDRVKL